MYCKGIAMAAGDVCPDSFADKEYAETAQSVLASMEPGMPVDLYPNETEHCFDFILMGSKLAERRGVY